jgi:hypothetical protein
MSRTKKKYCNLKNLKKKNKLNKILLFFLNTFSFIILIYIDFLRISIYEKFFIKILIIN